jgi:hypothetical protein
MATSTNKPAGRVRRVASAATDFVIDEVQNVLASTRNAIDIGRRSVQRARKPVMDQARETAGKATRAVNKAMGTRKGAKAKARKGAGAKPLSKSRSVSVKVKSRKTTSRKPGRAKTTRKVSRKTTRAKVTA